MIKEIKCNQFKLNKKTFRERFIFFLFYLFNAVLFIFECDKHFIFIKLPKFNKNAIYIYILNCSIFNNTNKIYKEKI
jgi:hypothetical protein